MAFTANELSNIANSALDFFMNKGEVMEQKVQAKPLLSHFEKNAKTFPGGKGDISFAVKGEYGAGGVNDSLTGFTHNDQVSFYTPANVKRAAFPWREHHIGLTLTHTELKIDGISVSDTNGEGVSRHSQRELTVLVNLLDDKLSDFAERYSDTLNRLLWGDGTTDAKALAGLRAVLVANPAAGTLGGLSRATYSWWRNRACTAAAAAASSGKNAVTSATANGGALVTELQGEFRQLRRYGGQPNTFYAGSDFIAAMEREMRANGTYTMNGFRGVQDAAMGGMQFDGVKVTYDPTLDDLGLTKRAYIWDSRHIHLMKMENEWKRQHTPARPHDQFVLYRSITCTGQLVAKQVNSALVIDIA